MSKINAYRVPRQHERKAAAELRAAGIRAYVPTERVGERRSPVARGYVFAAQRPAIAGVRHEVVRDASGDIVGMVARKGALVQSKHIKEQVGSCYRSEVRRLYQRSAPAPASAYSPGERIKISKGPMADIPATIIERVDGHAHWYWVESKLLGKTFRTKLHLPPRPG